ncbi:MAG: thioredoxin family protein [Nocardioides sp.]|nr:thioredoxin family protein [Nocardioides sp.]
MSNGAWIALAALVVALGFGGYRALTDGRFRGTRAIEGGGEAEQVHEDGAAWTAVLAALPAAERGSRATLLQFSSAFCAPCRATRRVLQDVAGVVPGVVHLELDAEHHLDLVRRLDVLRTPTTLVLDAGGHEVTRAAGAPRKEQVLDALTRLS